MRALLKNNKQNNNGFTHIDSDGSAHMVDVGDKKTTNRVAVASSEIIMEKETLDLIQNGGFEKGDVLGVAKVAGIMAAKKCSELIPLCHPLNINQIDIFFEENPSKTGIIIVVLEKNEMLNIITVIRILNAMLRREKMTFFIGKRN